MTSFNRMVQDATRKKIKGDSVSTVEKTSSGFRVTPDLSKLPSGEASSEIYLWVIAAHQEIERLRKKVGET